MTSFATLKKVALWSLLPPVIIPPPCIHTMTASFPRPARTLAGR